MYERFSIRSEAVKYSDLVELKRLCRGCQTQRMIYSTCAGSHENNISRHVFTRAGVELLTSSHRS